MYACIQSFSFGIEWEKRKLSNRISVSSLCIAEKKGGSTSILPKSFLNASVNQTHIYQKFEYICNGQKYSLIS